MGSQDMTIRFRGDAFRVVGKCSLFGWGVCLGDACGLCYWGILCLGLTVERSCCSGQMCSLDLQYCLPWVSIQ